MDMVVDLKSQLTPDSPISEMLLGNNNKEEKPIFLFDDFFFSTVFFFSGEKLVLY